LNRIYRTWQIFMILLFTCVLWSCNSQKVAINPCEKLKERLCNKTVSSEADCSEGTSIYNRSISEDSEQENDAKTTCQITVDKHEAFAKNAGFKNYDEMLKRREKEILFKKKKQAGTLSENYKTKDFVMNLLNAKKPCVFAIGNTDQQRVSPILFCVYDGVLKGSNEKGCILGAYNLDSESYEDLAGMKLNAAKESCTHQIAKAMLESSINDNILPTVPNGVELGKPEAITIAMELDLNTYQAFYQLIERADKGNASVLHNEFMINWANLSQ